MFHIVLHEPEIPPNTGNIIRLCANTGCTLHLVKPLGFELDRKAVRRAGLDYDALADVRVHDDLARCLAGLDGARLFAIETTGEKLYTQARFLPGDVFLFGSERRGLAPKVLAGLPPSQVLAIPMREGNRSLNMANAAAVVVYEAWRQCEFR